MITFIHTFCFYLKEFLDDPDADWVLEAIYKCEKWVEKLPEPDDVSLHSSG